MGLETNDIIEVLNRYSKVPVPDSIAKFIRDCTISYGKVKLVLKHNKYFVESSHPEIIQRLLKDPIIRGARIESADPLGTEKTAAQPPTHTANSAPKSGSTNEKQAQDVFSVVIGVDKEDLEDDDINISFQIDDKRIDVRLLGSGPGDFRLSPTGYQETLHGA